MLVKNTRRCGIETTDALDTKFGEVERRNTRC